MAKGNGGDGRRQRRAATAKARAAKGTAGQAKPKLLVNELSQMEFLSGSSENLTGQRRSTGAVEREWAFVGGHVCDIVPDQPYRSRVAG